MSFSFEAPPKTEALTLTSDLKMPPSLKKLIPQGKEEQRLDTILKPAGREPNTSVVCSTPHKAQTACRVEHFLSPDC